MKPIACNPPVVESGIPIPSRKVPGSRGCVLYETLRSMFADQSFTWPTNRQVSQIAKEMGIKVETRKINGDGYRIWHKGTLDAEPPPVWQPRCANEPRWPM
jgi:hypothetical protein